ncbi:MAG TPA: MerR family transcriptional regulator [Noviherbaspirillum sp.]|uniref:MerR family transcriptional regulator n=1 Tax=Noviherbaspirillum sp. TaxID=1926288 RepID=UPI002DDCC85B|nr:MerR family transcriptional regulator [Noviherbaspirillum sp.]HEV2609180.1 MerR family transcriptional regulator [Noviherbaspirillum sp.]
MDTSPPSAPLSFSIGSVQRETGLSKDTLRVWERRYAFPQPERDAFGERTYSLAQVEKLRLLKTLLDQGHRPSKIVHLGMDELRALGGQSGGSAVAADDTSEERKDLLHYIALCKSYQFDQLRRELSQSLMRMGLFRFVVEVVAPLNAMVGARWANGTFAIFEEHLYTESVHVVMRNAIASIPPQPATSGPRILLTTFPQESHGLGLLMAEAIFALEGACCISLGVQTPIIDIAQAAQANEADVVALSFSSAMNPNQVLEGLADLRSKLAPSVRIWVGGGSSVLYRRPPEFVRVVDLHEVRHLIEEWRGQHAA